MAITFTRQTMSVDETTGIVTPVESTITGSAIEKTTGEADAYARLNLARSEAPLLFFTPTTYGDQVAPGDTVQWPENGDTYTVRSARHLRPDGVVIASYVVVAR